MITPSRHTLSAHFWYETHWAVAINHAIEQGEAINRPLAQGGDTPRHLEEALEATWYAAHIDALEANRAQGLFSYGEVIAMLGPDSVWVCSFGHWSDDEWGEVRRVGGARYALTHHGAVTLEGWTIEKV